MRGFMTTKLISAIAIGVTLLTIGCSSNSALTPKGVLPSARVTDTTSTKSSSASFTKTLTHDPSLQKITQSTPFLTQRPPASKTIAPSDLKIDHHCLPENSNLLEDLGLEGVIILSSILPWDFTTFILDLETGNKIYLSEENKSLSNFAVSPNGKLLAYLQATFNANKDRVIDSRLMVLTADGEVQESTVWYDSWYSIRWLNDNHLDISLIGSQPRSHLIFDPFNGQQQLLNPVFPDFFNLYPIPDWDNSGAVVYDSSLNRVIYPRVGRESYEYVLWAPQNHQIVAVLPSYDIYHVPRWSPDGSQFLVAANLDPVRYYTFEFFSVNYGGLVSRLTHLTDDYGKMDIGNWSWSPDGHYIAFWLVLNPEIENKENLAVLDTSDRKVTIYCLQSGNLELGYTSPPPIWSPSSKQIVIEDHYAIELSNVMIVDFEKGYITRLAENMEPVGWLASTPP